MARIVRSEVIIDSDRAGDQLVAFAPPIQPQEVLGTWPIVNRPNVDFPGQIVALDTRLEPAAGIKLFWEIRGGRARAHILVYALLR